MKKIYEAENPALVWSARVIVEASGIRCALRNEFAGGASGLLAPIETWPELWVVDDRHAERARALLQDAILTPPQGDDWRCDACSEANAPSFGLCWNCGASAPPSC